MLFEVRGYALESAPASASVVAAGTRDDGGTRVLVVRLEPTTSGVVVFAAVARALKAAADVHGTTDHRPLHAVLVHAHDDSVHASVATKLAFVASRIAVSTEFWSERVLVAAAPTHVDNVGVLARVAVPPSPAVVATLPTLRVDDVLARWYDLPEGAVVSLTTTRVSTGSERVLRRVARA